MIWWSDWHTGVEIKRIVQKLDPITLTEQLLLRTEVKAIGNESFCLLLVAVLKSGQNLLAEAFSSGTKLQVFSNAKWAQ